MEIVLEPAVVNPIVSPFKVTTTAVLEAIEDAPDRVSSTKSAVGAPTVAVTLPLKAAVGLPDAAKKPEG